MKKVILGTSTFTLKYERIFKIISTQKSSTINKQNFLMNSNSFYLSAIDNDVKILIETNEIPGRLHLEIRPKK